ncbi:MAG: hypothetical protein VB862_15735 [Pirellulaceae bacterium]
MTDQQINLFTGQAAITSTAVAGVIRSRPAVGTGFGISVPTPSKEQVDLANPKHVIWIEATFVPDPLRVAANDYILVYYQASNATQTGI